ncbi:hypothetical protein CEUSTIGMA_g5288.t1 [Chlamydomonas eustigma]|uniref:Uncharacterized protein n=1 Tax=Chlamydomonas eustigma TaxID=1157962 RepID=A0A250X469_9CHLO|nr:hypothetical protein CEUSTIGMA_g5288.t1 [Chlamydomonas eustigma]|eukprot:GAX77846.1 hypothetical protein CEUSTIGMA_g5288.t1 [Chlamydomonas eustigma]
MIMLRTKLPQNSPRTVIADCSSRRNALIFTCTSIVAITSHTLYEPASVHAAVSEGVKCPGLRGYNLSKCLKELRLSREAEEKHEDELGSTSVTVVEEDPREARNKSRQIEQPGVLVTLPSGIQYREMFSGRGKEVLFGSTCEIQYVVYRLAPGAYFKYSSAGTPILLFALGFGFEGQQDDGEFYRFRLGDPLALPLAATPAVLGMQEGGIRRILIPPNLGWTNDKVGPRPNTFGGQRRLLGYLNEPLLLEVVLSRVIDAAGANNTSQNRSNDSGDVDRGVATRTFENIKGPLDSSSSYDNHKESGLLNGVPYKLPSPL